MEQVPRCSEDDGGGVVEEAVSCCRSLGAGVRDCVSEEKQSEGKQ